MAENLAPLTGRVQKKWCPSASSRGREMASRKAHNLEIGGSNPPPATKNYSRTMVRSSSWHSQNCDQLANSSCPEPEASAEWFRTINLIISTAG